MSIIPSAALINRDELPFITLDSSAPFINEGAFDLQLLQVNVEVGLWVIRTRFAPGTTVQKHLHTGEIFAFTSSGSWHYLEYPEDVNVDGSYLYEPAGSVHTLHVPASNTEPTEVCFVMNGANLNLDADGNVESVTDASGILEVYCATCEAEGKVMDRAIIGV
jgi:2,4'-dihydroxyacetophenone dioxygenase